MAKVLASRATSDEALQEQLERAAARFSSIHERWSGIADAPLALPASESTAPGAAASDAEQRGALGLTVPESGVCVTPILGIASSAEDEPRPRFKTLMGVPRSDPDADDSASSPAELPVQRSAEPAAAQAELDPLNATPPSPLRGLAETTPPAAMGSTAVSDTRKTLPPRVARALPSPSSPSPSSLSPWSKAAQTPPDIAAELAALRRSQRRRSWLVGVGSFAATLAVFAIAAPRERTLALRWLRDEYQSRVQPSLHVVADTARALKPSMGQPDQRQPDMGSAADGAGQPSLAAELRRIEMPPSLPVAAPAPDLEIDSHEASAAPTAEVAGDPKLAASTESAGAALDGTRPDTADRSPPPHRAARGQNTSGVRSQKATAVRAKAKNAMRGTDTSGVRAKATNGVRARGTRSASTAQPTTQVAAPRKRSTRAATAAKPTAAKSTAAKPTETKPAEAKPTRAKAAEAEPKPRAAAAMKERSTRQNSPRRAANGGIIRETPF